MVKKRAIKEAERREESEKALEPKAVKEVEVGKEILEERKEKINKTWLS